MCLHFGFNYSIGVLKVVESFGVVQIFLVMGRTPFYQNIDRTRTSFFEHRTNWNMFICWWSNSNTLFLASNDQTSNFEPNTVFTTFTKLLIELTRTSFFRTSNELERVHLMVIELEHHIFAFECSNIEHCSTHH